MAVFKAHISAQVTAVTKDGLGAVLAEDQTDGPGPSEGDVIRLAIEIGMDAVRAMGPQRRRVAYAHLRRGLPLPA